MATQPAVVMGRYFCQRHSWSDHEQGSHDLDQGQGQRSMKWPCLDHENTKEGGYLFYLCTYAFMHMTMSQKGTNPGNITWMKHNESMSVHRDSLKCYPFED